MGGIFKARVDRVKQCVKLRRTATSEPDSGPNEGNLPVQRKLARQLTAQFSPPRSDSAPRSPTSPTSYSPSPLRGGPSPFEDNDADAKLLMALCASRVVPGDDDDDDDDDEFYDPDAGEPEDDDAGAEVEEEEEEEFGDAAENYYDEDDEDDFDDDGPRIKETFAKATDGRQTFNWTVMVTGFDTEEDALAACDGKWFHETDGIRFRDRHQLERIIDGATKWKDRSSKVLLPDRAAETKRKLDCHSGHKCGCSLRVVGYENNTPGPDGGVEIKRQYRIEWNGVQHKHVYVSIILPT